ncbi:uncharacterized protein PV09_07211 [Verruconis gallopava]|uniref:Hydrophobin n=1 Tax=Verruconis gallopava TaxID=253628 RepID=A0A0D1YKV7_9PEZI|nr:uncharacterized protein PV09_07211 [Verruconis gallopava]KIW01452.1 hypothetical protein PV09_07211 [Verruconis gallopava]
MQFSAVFALLASVAAVSALPQTQGNANNQPAQNQPTQNQPTNNQPTQASYTPCSTGQPLCCGLGPNGQPDLNCVTPPSTPGSKTDFTQICAKLGQQPICCTSGPVSGGQATGCQAPNN